MIAPLSGEILDVNQDAIDGPEVVNDDPYGGGWLVRIRLSDSGRGRRPAGRGGLPRARRRAAVGRERRGLPLRHRRRPRGDARGDRRRLDRRPLRADARGRAARARPGRAARARRGGADAAPGGARGAERRHGLERALVPRAGHLRPLRARDRRHVPLPRRVPHRVHALPAGDEPGRAAGDLRVPDGDLRADGDGRLERVRLRRRAPSPPTPASSRRRTPAGRGIVLAETLHPQVRQVVKTYAPGFGMEVVEVATRGGVDRPGDARGGGRGGNAAIAIFPQPNAFGCLEPAPELAAAAASAGALAVAHVDLVSLGVLEAPGAYGCAMAIGEGQSVGCYQSYGGPHYGFLAAREEFIRRMPGRIVGETVDLEGERGFVLTLQTREQHIRREKATSNMTTNQTLLALCGLITLCWLGPAGAARGGGDLPGPRRATRGTRPGCRWRSTSRSSRRSRCARRSRPRRSCAGRARSASTRAIRSGATYPGLDDVLLVAAHREAHGRGRRPPCRGARGGVRLMELIYEKSRPGRRAGRPPLVDLPVPELPAALRRADAAAPARGARERDRPALHRARRPQLRHRHGLLPARQLHDEAQPARQRAGRRAARASAICIRCRRTRRRRARSS